MLFQGHYIYIDITATGTISENQLSLFRSPDVTATDEYGVCITFWYFLYGSNVNQLRLFIEQRDAVTGTLWMREGTRTQKWHFGQVLFCSPLLHIE